MLLGKFVEATSCETNPQEVFRLLRGFVGDLGFEQLAFGDLSGDVSEPIERKLPAPAIAVTYPEDWVQHYFQSEYQSIDPVVLHTRTTTAPLLWTDLERRNDCSKDQRKLFCEAREAGLFDGLSIPIHGPFGKTYVVSLASSSHNRDTTALVPVLRAAALQFFAAYYDASVPCHTAVNLTEREKDCLCWSARGKSNWDIGQIMAISEHTVDYHFRRALAKLGCSNRIVAVVTAIRRGLIHP